MHSKQIEARLRTNFPDATIKVVTDDEYHFFVKIISANFDGQSLLTRQRQVNKIFTSELGSGELHALSISTLTPAEAQQED